MYMLYKYPPDSVCMYVCTCSYACVLLCTLVVCACMNDAREAECVSLIYQTFTLYTKLMSLRLYSWYHSIFLTFLTTNRDILSASFLGFVLPYAFYVIFGSHAENNRRLVGRDICICKLSGGEIHMEKKSLPLPHHINYVFYIFICVLWFCFAAFLMKNFCNLLHEICFQNEVCFCEPHTYQRFHGLAFAYTDRLNIDARTESLTTCIPFKWTAIILIWAS